MFVCMQRVNLELLGRFYMQWWKKNGHRHFSVIGDFLPQYLLKVLQEETTFEILLIMLRLETLILLWLLG